MSEYAKVDNILLGNQRAVGLQDYLELFWRRKWWFISLTILGTLIATIYSYSLRPVYRSSTLILIEPQKVPTNYVSSTVTSSIQDRLRTISQQIMSRTNLTRIIREFNLYEPKKSEDIPQSNNLVERVKGKIKKTLRQVGLLQEERANASLPQDTIPEAVLSNMRKDISVKVTGKEAFAVTYSGYDPNVVMRVTNTLALLFIEENLKVRELQAEGTSEFLESQLREAERDLEKQEKSLREYREQHRGALPQNLDSNLRTLERLQGELQSIGEAIVRQEIILTDQQKLLVSVSEKPEEEIVPSLTPDSAEKKASAVEQQIKNVERELARMRVVFNESYPDVQLLTRQLEELRELAEKEKEVTESPSAAIERRVPPQFQAEKLKLARQEEVNKKLRLAISSKINLLEVEIQNLKNRRDGVRSKIIELEKQVTETSANEERLRDLDRDYDISLKNYQRLLEKRLNAKISENLEKKQKGEQFRILDPANLPSKPYKPNRPLVITSGSLIGGGLGLSIIMLLSFLNPSFMREEDIDKVIDIPVLTSIPRYMLKQQDKNNLIVLDDDESYVSEQYRLLFTKINEIRGHSKKVFAISSSIQAEGKTLTTLNLAVTMARDFGKRTLILEGDLRKPSICKYLNLSPEEGLLDILSERSDTYISMTTLASAILPFAHENLSLLPAIKGTNKSSSLLSSQKIRDLFAILRAYYDFILVDAPPILPLSDMNIFESIIDGIVMVVKAESTPQGAFLKATDTLRKDKIVGVILNGTKQPFNSYYRYGYKYDYRYSYKESANRKF